METLLVGKDVMRSELEGVQKILEGWHNVLTNGIPGIDRPEREEGERRRFFQAMVAELTICAAKCETLANVLATTIDA